MWYRITNNSQIPDTTSDYNGDGQRIRMNDDLTNTYYLYDGANVVADTDGTGVIKSYYLRGPSGNLISTENANKFYYYATDGLGSVAAITDETGAAVNEYKYDEFGRITAEKVQQGGIQNPFKFTGAIHDKTSNLYLMGSRYYNPQVGRFITQDSYGADYGADWTDHLYNYSNSNPVNFVDPTGHEYGAVRTFINDYSGKATAGIEIVGYNVTINGINEKRKSAPNALETMEGAKFTPIYRGYVDITLSGLSHRFYYDEEDMNGNSMYMNRSEFLSKMGATTTETASGSYVVTQERHDLINSMAEKALEVAVAHGTKQLELKPVVRVGINRTVKKINENWKPNVAAEPGTYSWFEYYVRLPEDGLICTYKTREVYFKNSFYTTWTYPQG